MKKTITFLLLVVSIAVKSQTGVNPSIYKPDSAIYYVDSLETERFVRMINKYDGDSIYLAAYWYDKDTVYYATKNIYYVDNNLPALPFEPLFSGGRKGSSSGYTYAYTSSIGDTLSKSYKYDFSLGIWVKESKTKHNISQEGIDTLAITHMWDENSKSWKLNNLVKQKFINGTTDSLEVLMLAPSLTDTIHYDVLSYDYNLNGDKSIIKRTTPGVLHLSIDSITYNESGSIDFIYYGDNNDCANMSLPDCDIQYKYDYAEQYFYDSKGRLDKIYFWDKQGLPDWEFGGSLKYYYSNQPTGIDETGINDSYTLYPNPCGATLTIESYTGSIEVYNLMGQLVISEQLQNGGQIDTSFLRNGVYVVKFGDLYSRLIAKH